MKKGGIKREKEGFFFPTHPIYRYYMHDHSFTVINVCFSVVYKKEQPEFYDLNRFL